MHSQRSFSSRSGWDQGRGGSNQGPVRRNDGTYQSGGATAIGGGFRRRALLEAPHRGKLCGEIKILTGPSWDVVPDALYVVYVLNW